MDVNIWLIKVISIIIVVVADEHNLLLSVGIKQAQSVLYSTDRAYRRNAINGAGERASERDDKAC